MNHMPSKSVFQEPGTMFCQIDGKIYAKDAKGNLVPAEAINDVDQLMDQTVRKIIAFAEPLAEQVARFKRHTYADINAFLMLILEKYGVKSGGKKGNLTITSFDGCLKVQVQNADQIVFGPELQAAKALVDDCLRNWSADAGPELRAIVTNAFQVDKEGKLNHAALFGLFRYDFQNEDWKQAMVALKDSIRIIGSKTYVRFYKRATADAAWASISIDLAQA